MDPGLIIRGAAESFARIIVIAVLVAFALGAAVAWLIFR